jgi:hypothetical protein
MKGDFSRFTFDKKKNYSGVLKQQGRVSLDADANELIDIIAHHRRVRTSDIIGDCGVPVGASGFEIRHLDNGLHDLLISTGRIYVDGLLCELHPGTEAPVTFPAGTNKKVQVKELSINGEVITHDKWVLISTEEEPKGIIAQITNVNRNTNILTLSKNISSLHGGTSPTLRWMILYSEQSTYPKAPDWQPNAGQTDLIYLDVWERHVTAIEEPDLGEVALGGPDTTTRTQTVSQVKIFPNVGNVECLDVISSWDDEIAPSGGRLKTQTISGNEPEDPCLIAEGGGYRRLENRLYRVEIHEGDDIGTATFKWSRDNGSIAYAIDEFIPDDGDPTKVFKVRLKQLGRDKILKIKENDWLEISGDETDLDAENAGTIAQVTNVDEAQRILTLSVDVVARKDENHAKVRRWDIGIDTPNPPTVTAAGPIVLEDGIQILFSGENFRVGDHWVFAARTATGKVEELDYEPPQGIKHHYCKLALVKWKGDDTVEIEDCRPEFHPLTELINFFYLSGDGQEAMPRRKLPKPLQVGVANGRWPVKGTKVKFEITEGNGGLLALSGPKTAYVATGVDGVAQCEWWLDGNTQSQQVKAVLLYDGNNQIHLPIRFNANLSVAKRVSYDPSICAKQHPDASFSATNTVQDAIDKICEQLAIQERCHDFLDDLRSDGIVLGEDGKMGFQVSEAVNPSNPPAISYTKGIAYVGGCRYEIPTGEIEVEDNTSRQVLLINALGEVKIVCLHKEPLPEQYAAVASITTYREKITQIIDMRFDLTHLDGKVKKNTAHIATKRSDRRQFVPLLVDTLPNLSYRDGRNYFFNVISPKGLAFDGQSIWVANPDADNVVRIDRDATDPNSGESIELFDKDKTYNAVFDGKNHVWFTALNSKRIHFVSTSDETKGSLPVGKKPLALAFGRDFMWVGNWESRTVSVIDTNRLQVVHTINMRDTTGMIQIHPMCLTFDGHYMWIGGGVVHRQEGKVVRIKQPWDDLEWVPEDPEEFLPGWPTSMVFDGSHVWFTYAPFSATHGKRGVCKIDVQTLVLEDLSKDFQNCHGLILDGSHIWLLAGPPRRGFFHKVDLETNTSLGTVKLAGTPLVQTPPVQTGVFDGTHLWYSATKARGRRAGVQKMLVG